MRPQFFTILLLALALISCRQQVTDLHIQHAELQLPPVLPDIPLALNGEWLYLPNELSDPHGWTGDNWTARQEKASRMQLPDRDQGMPVYGYATFVLKVDGFQNWPDAAFQFPAILTASRIYFKSAKDDRIWLIGEKGQVGTNPESYVPEEQKQLIPLPLGMGSGFLLIHVSNFQLRKSGITHPILIGHTQQLMRADRIEYGLDLWLIGLMLAIGVYNIFLFINRPEDYSSLTLSFFSLVVLGRLITTENLLEYWFNAPSWTLTEIRYKIEYASIIIAPLVVSIFFHAHFPKRFSVGYIKVSLVLGIVQMLPIVFLSSYYFTPFLYLFQICLVVSGIYATFCGLSVVWHRDPEWLYIVIGGFPFSLVVGLDVMVARGMLSINYSTPYVMVWFTLTQSNILGQRFAKAFRTARHLSAHLQNEVETQTAAIAAQSRSMRAILDNVPVGVFTLSDASLAIDPDYSQHLERIFSTEAIADRDLSEFLLKNSVLDADEINQIEQILQNSLHEAELNFTLNEDGLCREIIKPIEGTRKILSISWVPIVDDARIVRKILVTVHDISEIRQLAQESQERMNHLNRIAEILQVGKEQMLLFFRSTRRLLTECKTLSADEMSKEAIKIMFINIHTIKGNGRQLQLRQMTESAHHCERLLQELRQNPQQWHRAAVEACLDELQSINQSYEKQLEALQLQSRLEIEVRHQKPHLVPILQKHLHDQGLTPAELETLSSYAASTVGVELRAILSGAFQEVDTLARDLGKDPPLTHIECPRAFMNAEAQEFLQNILVHVLRNSLDHGLEDAQERTAVGKPRRGSITVQARRQNGNLRLRIQDDGRGLNLSRLKKLMDRPASSHLIIANTIFEDGVSTAAAVTEISGRGMGMPAIRRYVENAGGIVNLELDEMNAEGFCPFRLILSLPDTMLLWAEPEMRRAQPVAS